MEAKREHAGNETLMSIAGKLIRRLSGTSGQGAGEYAMIVSAIAIACLGAYNGYGAQLFTMVQTLGTRISGFLG